MKKAIAICFGITIGISFFFLGSIKSGSAEGMYATFQDYDDLTPVGDTSEFIAEELNTTECTIQNIGVSGNGIRCQTALTFKNATYWTQSQVYEEQSDGQCFYVKAKNPYNTSFWFQNSELQTNPFPIKTRLSYPHGDDASSYAILIYTSASTYYEWGNWNEEQWYKMCYTWNNLTDEFQLCMDSDCMTEDYAYPGEDVDTFRFDFAVQSEGASSYVYLDEFSSGHSEISAPEDTQSWFNIYSDDALINGSDPKPCFKGIDCDFEFTYSYGAMGYDVYLWEVPYATSSIAIGDEIASSTIPTVFPEDPYINVTTINRSDVDRMLYCAAGEKAGDWTNTFCFTATWQWEYEWNRGMGIDFTATTTWSATSTCYDIPGSDASFYERDFWYYAFACSARTVGNYLFKPSTKDWLEFQESNRILTTNFPLSVVWQVSDIIEGLASTTPATSTVVIAPLKWWDADTQTWKETGTNLLDTGMFEEKITPELWNFYWLWFGYLIKGLFAWYVFSRIFGLIAPESQVISRLSMPVARTKPKKEYGRTKIAIDTSENHGYYAEQNVPVRIDRSKANQNYVKKVRGF